MINKYRKKPVVVEAIIWNGKTSSLCAISDLVNDDITLSKDKYLYIQTLEGKMKANIGDYIIKGVKGECYPCKPDIFEQTYELVEE